jgi:hypothetical protein
VPKELSYGVKHKQNSVKGECFTKAGMPDRMQEILPSLFLRAIFIICRLAAPPCGGYAGTSQAYPTFIVAILKPFLFISLSSYAILVFSFFVP